MALRVIGAGFGRTGTASLKLALETLGCGPCYHMSEVLSHAGHVDLWLDVAAGKPDWDAIFSGYASTVDFPAANYWRELAEFYPDAKLLLSMRSAESWFQSTQETILSQTLQEVSKGTRWRQMVDATTYAPLGNDLHDHDALIAAFHAHNEAVKQAFRPERLLVFEAKDGWAPLCDFLGVSTPDEPYPRINSRAEFEGLFAMMKTPMGQAMMAGRGLEGGSAHERLFDKDKR